MKEFQAAEWIGDEIEQNQDHRQEDKSECCCDNEMEVGGSLAQDDGHGVGECHHLIQNTGVWLKFTPREKAFK